jgi:hypothetical protein
MKLVVDGKDFMVNGMNGTVQLAPILIIVCGNNLM